MSAPAARAAPTWPFIPALAPMEGVSDPPYRLFQHLVGGVERMHTPFLRVTASYPPKDPRPFLETLAPELTVWRGAVPYELVPQMMASSPADFIRTAPHLFAIAPTLDINCGCPAPRVVGHGAGSGLLADPERFRWWITTLTDALGPERLGVKIRTGYDDTGAFDQLIAGIVDQPLVRLTVHGRTRAQGYSGEADWHLIQRAAAKLPYPVIGSGDIACPATFAARLRLAPGVAGAIIGRGAIGNPWVFTLLRRGHLDPPPLDLLVPALGVYGILHELFQTDRRSFLDLGTAGLFSWHGGTEPAAWQALYRRIAMHAGLQEDPLALTTGRYALGRTKMLYGAMTRADLWDLPRVSARSGAAGGAVLKAATLGDFLARVAGTATTATRRLPVHNPSSADLSPTAAP